MTCCIMDCVLKDGMSLGIFPMAQMQWAEWPAAESLIFSEFTISVIQKKHLSWFNFARYINNVCSYTSNKGYGTSCCVEGLYSGISWPAGKNVMEFSPVAKMNAFPKIISMFNRIQNEQELPID